MYHNNDNSTFKYTTLNPMADCFTKLCKSSKRDFSSDCDNLGNAELKTLLTDVNFNIVVNTQTTLLLHKPQPD